jgi:hypothetical protein
MVTLKKKKKEKNVVEMNALKDGQIAIIVEDFMDYKNMIVQRYRGSAVPLGMNNGKGWSDITTNTLRVRILKNNEKLIVTNNE